MEEWVFNKATALGKKGVLLQLIEQTPQTQTPTCTLEPIEHLLNLYPDIFAIPFGLPPPRSHDYNITLQPDTQLVSVRPYRYPYF